MLVLGPQTLTVGQANPVVDPAQTGNPSVACQIQNSSPYQLSVLAAGDGYSIQPFFAQTIPVAGGVPIQITPLAQAGLTQACSVTLTFLLEVAPQTGVLLSDGETWVEAPPQQDGPLTAAAIASALSVQGSIDVLLAPTTEPTGAGVVQLSLVAKHSYNSITVQAGPITSTPVAASVLNAEGQSFSAPMLQGLNNGGLNFQAIIPCTNAPGDTLIVSIYFLAPAASALISVQGSTAGPTPLMRADGRAHPMGNFSVGSSTPSTTLIAAPAIIPVRIHIKSFALACLTASISLQATLQGSLRTISILNAAGTVDAREFEAGLLCDQNTAVNFAGAGTGAASMLYDLVV